MSNPPFLNIANVSKSYGSTQALCNVSLQVQQGEILGLVGPDGSGKTSLFRIVATLLLADQGSVSIQSPNATPPNATPHAPAYYDVVRDMQRVRSMVGYMPGRFSLYEDLTVRENLEFFATIFGTSVSEGRELIDPIYSQIEPFANRRAGALSGGMKQKLALSCALVHRPHILLLDEPTTGVDPVSRKELWQMLKSLKASGLTIVASTPYVDEILCCDRVAYLSQGHLVDVDTPQQVIARNRAVFDPELVARHAAEDSADPTDTNAPNARPASICVSHLVKAFGDFRAVDDISFRVAAGEVFGFLGANGAGKTTAMRMLTGLSLPTSGSGTVAGLDILTQQEQIKRRIGYMSQRFSLYEDLTIAENLSLFGGIYGLADNVIAQRSNQMLTQLGIADSANLLVRSLPLGLKQRLAFCTSIIHEPEIVFLDEPTGGVDADARQHFWDLICSAAERGITVFVTSHYMDEAERCDRVSIMVDGKIRALGSPAELKKQFGMPDMDHVFTHLARQATRSSD